MKVPLSWLKEYLDISLSPNQIAETLTLAGLEVDEVESLSFSFSGVVTAKVLKTAPHPDADRLQIAQVFDGTEEFQVVCGASNCREGIVTAFAKIGASLQDPDGKAWNIKKGKLRGIESFGMLCAPEELGLPFEINGILELPSESALGVDVSTLYTDTLFHLSLTPNLGHCMSIYGIARELAALLNIPLKTLQSDLQEDAKKPSSFSIEINPQSLCSRYMCRLVESVQVAPSPDWLVTKLSLVGLKSINNVIDVSNYVMMKTGQPLHFFDADSISGHTIYVSETPALSTEILLDGSSREIPAGALVIRDQEKALAIAGVMGLKNSSISDTTKNILIEAALFPPVSIRKTSKILSLKTDASQRFEKGIDPLMTPYALDLATKLLVQIASGQANEKKSESNPHPFIAKKVLCRASRVNQILGLKLSITEISNLLKRLQIKIVKEHSDSLEALIPSHRNDLVEEIDLIEEVARLYGFNHIPRSKLLHYTSTLPNSPVYCFENKVRDLLLQEGLQEFMTCDLISPLLSQLTLEKSDTTLESVSILQPKSSDYSVLRHSLLPGILQSAKYNFDHQIHDIASFEVGRIHFNRNGQYQEQPSIAVFLSGNETPYHYQPRPRPVDFFDLKGILENLLDSLQIDNVSFEESSLESFQPGRQARIFKDDLYLGVLGEIHPATLQAIDFPQRVYFAELSLLDLLDLHKKTQDMEDLPLYPASERDWTVSLSKKTPIGKFLQCIQELAPPVLQNVFLLDVFEGAQIGPDRKNVTWRFIYRDAKKTLDLHTIESLHTKLIQKVAEKLEDCIL